MELQWALARALVPASRSGQIWSARVPAKIWVCCGRELQQRQSRGRAARKQVTHTVLQLVEARDALDRPTSLGDANSVVMT